MKIHLDASSRTQINDLMRDLRKVDPALVNGVRRELRRVAKIVADDARRRAPRKSGALQRSIRPSVSSTGDAAVVASAPHARITELGGRHPLFGNKERWYPQPRRPYLIPARDAHQKEFIQAADAALNEAAKKAGF